MNLCST